MRIIKHFETKLNISSEEMYMGDLDQILIDKLRAQYEGICENQSYVQSIQKINKRSMITIDKSDLQGGGSVSVDFSAEVLIYPTGTILVGCEIQNIENNGYILCQYDNALIYIRGDRTIHLDRKDKIIIQVLQTKYPKGEKLITVVGSLFHITNEFNMIALKPPLAKTISQEYKDALGAKLIEINDAEKELGKHQSKLVKFFTDTLYPFNKPLTPVKDFKTVNFLTIAQDLSKGKDSLKPGESIIVSKHPALRRETPEIITISPKTKPPQNNWTNPQIYKIKINPADYAPTILNFMQEYLEYITALSNMCEVYKTEAARNSHKKLWNLYNKLKITI